MRNSLRLAAIATLVVVALAGCVQVQIDLTLTPDDTVNGTMVLALQEGIGELLDTTDAAAAEQLFGDTTANFDDAAVSKYAQDGYEGQKVTFEGQSIGDFALVAGDFTISRDDENYVVNGPVDPKVAANGADIPESAQMSLSVTFPGPVYEHNGSLEGNTVTWDLTRAPAEIHAVGAAQATSEKPAWLFPVIGAALLLAVAVVLVFVMRQHSAPTATTSAASAASATSMSPSEPIPVRPPVSPRPTITSPPEESKRP